MTHRSGGSAHQNDPLAKGRTGGALPAGGGRALPPRGRLDSRKPFPCWRLLPGLGGALGSGVLASDTLAGSGPSPNAARGRFLASPSTPDGNFWESVGHSYLDFPRDGGGSRPLITCSISAPRVDFMAQEDVYFSSSMLCDVKLCYGDWEVLLFNNDDIPPQPEPIRGTGDREVLSQVWPGRVSVHSPVCILCFHSTDNETVGGEHGTSLKFTHFFRACL